MQSKLPPKAPGGGEAKCITCTVSACREGQAFKLVKNVVASHRMAWACFHTSLANHQEATQGAQRAAQVLHLV